jgi:YfiH family protein
VSWFEIPLPMPARFSYRDEPAPDEAAIASGEQVHGVRIAQVSHCGREPATDGLITEEMGLTIGIRVADCAAVLFAAPRRGIIAAVHAGWRGAAGGIHLEAVRRMVDRDAAMDEIHVWISPCISLQAFEVGDEVAARFPERFVHRHGFQKPHVDLPGYLADGLLQAGVPQQQMLVDGRCTVSDAQRFHSYRREGIQAGRMWAMITNRPIRHD